MLNYLKLTFLSAIILFTSILFCQSHSIDSLIQAALEEHKNDLIILPFFKRIDASISFKELDLTKFKVKNRKGTFNLEINICGHEILLPKSNDLTSNGPIKFNDLLLENGNVLVADGWIHTLVVGHAEFDNMVTTYTMGVITSKLHLKGNRVVKFERAQFDYTNCQYR